MGCKVLFTIFNYILGANYMWIFAEGMYLHMLISVAMFSEKSGVKKLIIFGWGELLASLTSIKRPFYGQLAMKIYPDSIRRLVIFRSVWQ